MARKKSDADQLASTFKALGHPTRIEVFREIARAAPISASQFAPSRDRVGTVAHHFRVLERAGLIETAALEQRRGALMRSYRLSNQGRQVSRRLGL